MRVVLNYDYIEKHLGYIDDEIYEVKALMTEIEEILAVESVSENDIKASKYLNRALDKAEMLRADMNDRKAILEEVIDVFKHVEDQNQNLTVDALQILNDILD